jgi:pSer/pThr/pTyr-binding forkhead associated (FHA) protein
MPGLRLRLDPNITTIGRASDSTIRINERTMNWETVSKKHAEIRREGNDYVIYDVSHRNGVYVEGQRTARNLLRSGWRIGIGGVEFIFQDADPAGQ